jgi:hypothetical protein
MSGLAYRSTDSQSDTLGPLISHSGHVLRRGAPHLARRRSRGSIGSESTFPMRADAYHATNLRTDPAPQILPPALPYPSLAPNRGLTSFHTVRSAISNSSTGSGSTKTGGGFFSAIGRKTSMRGKDRTLAMFANANAQNRQQRYGLGSGATQNSTVHPHATPMPRPIQLETTPTLPGGPRAAPPRRTSVFATPPGLNPTSLNFSSSADQAPRSAPLDSNSSTSTLSSSIPPAPRRKFGSRAPPSPVLPPRPPVHPSAFGERVQR